MVSDVLCGRSGNSGTIGRPGCPKCPLQVFPKSVHLCLQRLNGLTKKKTKQTHTQYKTNMYKRKEFMEV